MYLHLVDGGAVDGYASLTHAHRLAFDDVLSPPQQIILRGEVRQCRLALVEVVEFFHLRLDLAALHGKVKYLYEMRYVHSGILHELAIATAVGNHVIDVRVVLRHDVLQFEQTSLCFRGQTIGDDLLGEIGL